MKKHIKILSLIALTLFILSIFSLKVYAVDPEFYEPPDELDDGTIITDAGVVLSWISYIGIIIGVVALTIIGLKYMLGSVEGKAEYKKAMVPYLVGAVLLTSASTIVKVILSITGA